MVNRKITKSQIEALAELKRRGGAVITSQWINGNGRYTTRRAIPPHCDRIPRWLWSSRYPTRIKKVFQKHPKCEAVIAITNMRAVNKILAERGE